MFRLRGRRWSRRRRHRARPRSCRRLCQSPCSQRSTSEPTPLASNISIAVPAEVPTSLPSTMPTAAPTAIPTSPRHCRRWLTCLCVDGGASFIADDNAHVTATVGSDRGADRATDAGTIGLTRLGRRSSRQRSRRCSQRQRHGACLRTVVGRSDRRDDGGANLHARERADLASAGSSDAVPTAVPTSTPTAEPASPPPILPIAAPTTLSTAATPSHNDFDVSQDSSATDDHRIQGGAISEVQQAQHWFTRVAMGTQVSRLIDHPSFNYDALFDSYQLSRPATRGSSVSIASAVTTATFETRRFPDERPRRR